MLRLRQICLVAADLSAAEADIESVFGLSVCFRDPAVGRWGLENVLYPVGHDFLEVVAPTRNDTAASRYLERRKGDGGYIVILQCDEVERRRTRMQELGIRIISDLRHDDYVGMQLHPRDTGGAMLETSWNAGDEQRDGPWHPAGKDWRPAVRTERVGRILGAELQSDDPAGLAARWGEILGVVPGKDDQGNPELGLEDAVLRFVAVEDGRGEGLSAVDLAVADRNAVLSAARQRNCPVVGNIVTVCGTRFHLL